MDYSKMDDADLQIEFDNLLRVGNEIEAQFAKDELDRRGYSFPSSYSPPDVKEIRGKVTTFSPIMFLVFIVVMGSLAFYFLPKGIYQQAIPAFHDHFIFEQRPYYPLETPYSSEVLQTKVLVIKIVLEWGVCIFALFAFMSCATLRKLPIRYISVPCSTLVGLSSFYLMFEEFQQGEATVLAAIMYVLTFAVCLLPMKQLKKNVLIGIYIMIVSCAGFIIAGNSLISPFFTLCLSGAILTFNRGNFWGIGRKKVHNKMISKNVPHKAN
ncbi:hypothetical protein CN918_31015 [Priestia megaterium]|nr:hypothetical protein CN918_31015 [Priestia megaterium]